MQARKSGYKRFAVYVLLLCLSALWGCSGSDSSSNSSGSSSGGSVFLRDSSVKIESAYIASVPSLGYRERAMITQGQGEYAGVDNWAARDPIPAGTRLVNGGTSNLFSMDFSDRSTTAYSNYFATENALEEAMSGELLDSAFFNGLVQVGPWRPDGATGNFTYRRFGMTYEVVRPMPVAYSVCSNNPQMNTTGAQGGASQFFVPFIRQDLIRLGYVKIVNAVDSSSPSRVSTIPRYVDLSGRTTTADELSGLALADYTFLIGSRTPQEQALAAALRAEATTLRTDKKRSANTFDAQAVSGDITLASDSRIDGFARVHLVASRDISLSGTIWGADKVTSEAGGNCSVTEGALVEAWTDRINAGDQAVWVACNVIQVAGRIQTQAAPWASWSQGVPGKITLMASSVESASTGISISGRGQVLSLLQTSQTDSALNTVRMTSPGSSIDIDGLGYGFNIVADKGTIHIENTGSNGSVRLFGQAALSADIVKAGAVGSYGSLVVHAGSNLDANTLIKLFGGDRAGGTIIFRGAGDVILTAGDGADTILISADTVEVETGTRLVTRSWVKTGGIWNRVDVPADVYCNQCNWSAVSGGDPAPGYNGTWSTVPNRAGPPPADRTF